MSKSGGNVNPERIFQVGLGFWGSKTLLTAIEVGLFTELANGPLSRDTLTEKLRFHRRSARDFFDTLVSLGFLERDGDVYSNTVETATFLDRRKPSYVGGIFEMANARLYRFWGNLTQALRTGLPQNEIAEGGDNPFDQLYADPDRLKGFLSAMTGLSIGAGQAIARQFPWKNYKTFIDVGTAQGGVAVQIALAHPHLSGLGYDLPVVQPIFDEYVSAASLSARLRFHPGNFFVEPLPNTDVILMGHILHDWDLEQKKLLIRKAYDALNPGGAYIVFEAIIDDDRRQNAFGLMMSLNMLIETPGGFDYTGAEAQSWMREAGFQETRVEHILGPDSMVIGIK